MPVTDKGIGFELFSNQAGDGPPDLHMSEAAKAKLNLNGDGVIAVRASLNSSSVLDAGSGRYENSVTSPFKNSEYTCVGTGSTDGSSNGNRQYSNGHNASAGSSVYFPTYTVNSYRIAMLYRDGASGLYDATYIHDAVFGDLA